ncbi:M35 family metallo-endopeptidase [Kitasatospora griseola]|uniref:M35 family metallo-endopeptidase n=1 Tax=Kitasatospora griseola TaxID=2064 RepID=UPI0034333725
MKFIGSSADQENAVKAAVTAATDYIANASKYVANLPSDSTGKRYTTWFGKDDPQRRAVVQSVLNNLSNSDFTDFTYDCSTDADPHSFGSVDPEKFGFINLGPLFWKAPATGTDSQAGLLVRLASKFLNNGGNQDHEYGYEDCQELARTMPEKAITNPDNYGYFVENDPALA